MSTWVKKNFTYFRVLMVIVPLIVGGIYAESERRQTLRNVVLKQVKADARATVTSDKVLTLLIANKVYNTEMPVVKGNIQEIKDEQNKMSDKLDEAIQHQVSLATSVDSMKESQRVFQRDMKENQRILQQDIKLILQKTK